MDSHSAVKEDGFGLVESEIVRRYTLTNKNKASVTLITWGAGIQSVKVPNNRGTITDIALGWDDINGYLENRYIGRIIGRVTNRIYNNPITIDDKEFYLSNNDNDQYHINGGYTGFDSVNWNSYIFDKQVIMSYLSKNGSDGYPGDLLTQIKYNWTDDSVLQVIIRATCTQPTPVDISNCCYFNLAGHGTGPEELSKHVTMINADKWADIDVNVKMPTCKICHVADSIFDLRIPTVLSSKLLRTIPGGVYNHNYCVNCPSTWCYRFHARISHPDSGRFVEIYSNQPGLHFSTANNFTKHSALSQITDDNSMISNSSKNTNYLQGKGGVNYERNGAFSISPQNYPNNLSIAKVADNNNKNNNFPSCILYPGQVYYHEMSLKFGVIN